MSRPTRARGTSRMGGPGARCRAGCGSSEELAENLRPVRRVRENAATVQAARFLEEPLATLGNSIALYRTALAPQRVALVELNARGELHRAEEFAAERLGEAVVRLYERHAELMPAGPRRDRAAAIARSIAAAIGPLDPERM